MFNMLESLVKATVGAIVLTPIAVVADVVTLGGSVIDRDTPYTAETISSVVKNVENAVKPNN